MQIAAKAHGGKCLSKRYVNSMTPLTWQCKEGHIWKATPNSTRCGSWCPKCGRTTKRTIEDMRKIAERRGGKCLSDRYEGALTPLTWQCEERHVWKAAPNNVKNCGSWCPVCAHCAKLTIEEMQRIAESRGGECLSKHYVNCETKLVWRCGAGHVWEASPGGVKYGHWCRWCAAKKKWEKRRAEQRHPKNDNCVSSLPN